MATKVVAAKGSRISNDFARTVHTEMLDIEDGQGRVTPEALLRRAESSESPIHSFFEWDDSKAAHAHRLSQARYLIRSVRVVIERSDEDAIDVRAFVRVGDEGKSYRNVVAALSNRETRQELLTRALGELEVWQRRYSHLEELAQVMEAIGLQADVMRGLVR